MAAVTPNEDISKLIEAFGIDAQDLVSFTLKINVNEIVSIKLEKYPNKIDIEKGAKEVDILMKKYELVEKKK